VIYAIVLLFAFWDLGAVKAEPDLNKRSELALVNAEHALDQARQAYKSGDQKSTQSALEEVSESVALCYDALQHTDKAPRKSKYYKRAELKVQELIRRLSGFRDEVGFQARPFVERVINNVSNIHDQLITDIMSKKKHG
jgi:hypothetical protein